MKSCRCRESNMRTARHNTDSPCVQLLDQNFEYIKVIAEHQKRGRTADANLYSAKLRDNLVLLGKQAERQPAADINQVQHDSECI